MQVVDRIALKNAIAELPNGYRSVFVLHDVEGFEHEGRWPDHGYFGRHLEIATSQGKIEAAWTLNKETGLIIPIR